MYSLLSLFCLSIALTSIILIINFISTEKSFDKAVIQGDDQYFVTLTQKSSTTSREVGLLTTDFYDLLNNESGVKDITTIRSLGSFYIESGDVKVNKSLTLARENLFEYFDLKFINGTAKNALSQPNSIVLSSTTANSLFGNENPVGKVIHLIGETEFNFTVTGVVDEKVKSHMRFDNFISWDSKSVDGEKFSDWYKYSIYIYLKSDVDQLTLTNQLSSTIKDKYPDASMDLNLYPFRDVYFETADVEFMMGFNHGNKQNIIILSIIGLLILVIGTVNYVNINISLVLKRVREIGVRKVLGASNGNLRQQFFIDAIIMILVSGIIAFTFADLLVAVNADFLASESSVLPTADLLVLGIVLALLLSLVLITGYYPTLLTRKIPLSQTLKNQVNNTGSKAQLSNTLLGVQFTITFALILMTAIVFRQYDFLQTKDPGFQKENILTVNIGESKSIPGKKEQALHDFRKVPGVLAATMSTDVLGQQSTNMSYYASTPEMQNVEEEGAMSYYFGVDTGFIDTYHFQLREGRNFDVSFASDSMAVIVNETLIEKLNLKDPIGKEIRLFGNNSNSRKDSYKIIGVVKDFNFQSLHKEVSPTAFYLNKRNFWYITLRFKSNDIQSFNEKIAAIWSEYDKEIPYQYSFLDDQIERYYTKEKTFNDLISRFTFVSLLLSVLGLFGVTSYTIQQKRKEISIRKVLGASVMELLYLFNKKYLAIFVIAVIIAIPAVGWATSQWLSNFAYRIDNNVIYYLISALILVTIVIVTVSISSFRFANSQPAKYLRDD